MSTVALRAKADVAKAKVIAKRYRDRAAKELRHALSVQELAASIADVVEATDAAARDVGKKQRRLRRSRFKVKSLMADKAPPEDDAFFPKGETITFASKGVEDEWKAISENARPEPLCPTPQSRIRASQQEAAETCALAVAFLLLDASVSVAEVQTEEEGEGRTSTGT